VLMESNMGKLHTVYPILCGQASRPEDPEYPESSDFFKVCSNQQLKLYLADVV